MQVGDFLAVSTVDCPRFFTCIIYANELRKKRMATSHGWDYGQLRKDRRYFKLQSLTIRPNLQKQRAFSCEQPSRPSIQTLDLQGFFFCKAGLVTWNTTRSETDPPM